MLTPAPMKRVSLFILSKDEQKVMHALGRLKLLHLEPAKTEIEVPLKEKPNRDKVLERGRRLLARIEGVVEDFECSLEGPAESIGHLTVDEISGKLREIEAARDEL